MSRNIRARYRGIVARYTGGMYIDLYDRRTGRCYDNINVWDYEAGRPTIRPTGSDVLATLMAVVDSEPEGRGDPSRYR